VIAATACFDACSVRAFFEGAPGSDSGCSLPAGFLIVLVFSRISSEPFAHAMTARCRVWCAGTPLIARGDGAIYFQLSSKIAQQLPGFSLIVHSGDWAFAGLPRYAGILPRGSDAGVFFAVPHSSFPTSMDPWLVDIARLSFRCCAHPVPQIWHPKQLCWRPNAWKKLRSMLRN